MDTSNWSCFHDKEYCQVIADTVYPDYEPAVQPKSKRAKRAVTSTSFESRAIVIDAGSYECRAGWSHQENPWLQFRPLVGKLRPTDMKNLNSMNEDTDEYTFSEFTRATKGYVVGNDLQPFDFAKYNARSAHEKDVIYNTTIQEHIFDYIFYKLGLSSCNGSIPHPVVMTECITNPNYSRSKLSELLFEGYEVPSICYGIDALFSYYHFTNNMKSDDWKDNSGLVIRSGFHTTHVLPIFNIDNEKNCFKFDVQKVRRISVAGFHATDYMMKIIQLKYPFLLATATMNPNVTLNIHTHLNGGFTIPRAQELKEKHCYTSLNYLEEINRLATDETYFKKQTHIIFDNESELNSAITYYSLHKNELEKLESAEGGDQNANSGEKARSFDSKQQAEQWLRLMHVKLINTISQLRTITDQLQVNDGGEQPTDIKSKRTAATKQRKRAKIAAAIHEGDDDTFGASDDHWHLYNEMERPSKKLGSKERKQLQKDKHSLENEIASINREIQLVEQDIYGVQKSIVPTFFMNQYKYQARKHNDVDDTFYNAIYLTVERTRAPEIVFEPSMIGLENAGLAEIIQNVISQYSIEQQQQLLRNVYLCGGNTRFPQFSERIAAEIRSITPNTWPTVNIYSEQSSADAWRGASEWYENDGAEKESAFITRKMYEEQGANYLQTHFMSNQFINATKSADDDDEE